jgi:hypothetical protein
VFISNVLDWRFLMGLAVLVRLPLRATFVQLTFCEIRFAEFFLHDAWRQMRHRCLGFPLRRSVTVFSGNIT